MDKNDAVGLTGFVDELRGLLEVRDHVEYNIVVSFQEEMFDMPGNETACRWNEDYGENVCHFQTSQTYLGIDEYEKVPSQRSTHFITQRFETTEIEK